MSTISEVASVITGEALREGGVAIVAACRNRQDTLKKVLPTWLAVDGVDDIIIVDWASDPPLKSIVQPDRDPRLKLFRVNDESSWVLSRAYNLALNQTEMEYIIRTDCDYMLEPDILSAHALNMTHEGFYSGNWNLARDENEVHLNGAMVMKKEIFWNVGGYDERIQTYGWDDEDLYTRLRASNIDKLNMSYDHVSHVSHGDGSRAQKGVKFAQVQIDLNQLLLEKLPVWSQKFVRDSESSSYETLVQNDSGYTELKAVHVPSALKDLVTEEEYAQAWALALGRRLADDFHVPWDILEAMDCANKEIMLRSLMSLQNDLNIEQEDNNSTKTIDEADKSKIPTMARLLFVHCMHGLGNRLRAMGSAFAFAKNTRRIPVVIWESDAHIAAEFDALFNTSEIAVLTDFKPKWPFTDLESFDASWKHFKFYNYMEMEEGAVKGEPIVNEVDKHLYYKGAYVMEAPDYSWWEADNQELQQLKPVGLVHEKLDELEKKGLSSSIGVHIRNRTLAADIKNVNFNEEYGTEAAKTMEHWRMKSSYSTFVTEMQRILKEDDPDAKFYIATDTWEVIPLMEKEFPGKILSTPRKCDDRDSECVKYAVIDVYALSKTKQLLGSNWSSYTEIAERLGGLKARLAGQDFGGENNQSVQEKNIGMVVAEKSEEELAAEEEDRWLDRSRER